MKKFILSIILAITLIASSASAEFFPDVIVTSSNGIWTDSRAYVTLNAAITAVSTNERTIKIVSPQIVTALTVPSNVTLSFERNGSITNSGQLTINSRNIIAKDRQIFTGTGDIDFAVGSVVRSAWFSDVAEAINVTIDDELTLIISKASFVTSSCAVGNNVNLKWESARNQLTANGGVVISNIKNIEAGNFQLFAGAGDFDFLDGTELKLNWFARLSSVLTWVESEEITIIVNEDSNVQASVATTANENLKILSGGKLILPAGVIFTAVGSVDASPNAFDLNVTANLIINGPFNAGLYQVFSGTGSVVFGSGSVKEVYPEYWGAKGDDSTDDITAIQSACDSGVGVSWQKELTYKIGSTLTLSGAHEFKFNNTTIHYTGDSIGVYVPENGPIISNLYVGRTLDFSDSAIGVQIKSMRRNTASINVYGYTTGIQLLADSATHYFGYNFFEFRVSGCKIGLHIKVEAPGWMTSCSFYDLTAGAVGKVAGSIGVKMETDGGTLNSAKFYSSIIEGSDKGMYLDSTGGGFALINPYFENNNEHVRTGATIDNLSIFGGFATSSTTIINSTQMDNVDTKVMMLYPFREWDYMFLGRGLYAGMIQGFHNYVKNGHFRWWSGVTPVGWTGATQEAVIVKFGDYSIKQDRTGVGVGNVNQSVDSYAVGFMAGQNVTLGAWVYSPSNSGAQLHIVTDAGDSGYVGNAKINEWEFIKLTFEVPAGATTMTLWCRAQANTITYHDGVIFTLGENSPNFYSRGIVDYDIATGSVTWNPINLVDGAGETKSLTVTGAALGDFVLVSAPYDLQDMTVTGYVQAANTVEIRLQNESGGAIDLGNGTWKVKVWKQ